MSELQNAALIAGSIGENNRDASSTIRGYIFQNLLAIEQLIKPNTARVFCEYIEDVSVIDEDNNCRIIQAKYYASGIKTSTIEDVYKELYSDYLRLSNQIFHFHAICPELRVFSPDTLNTYFPFNLSVFANVKPTAVTKRISSINDLASGDYNKAERMAAVIDKYGSDESLKDCYKYSKIEKENKDLAAYKEHLGNELVKVVNKDLDQNISWKAIDLNNRKNIVLSIAYQLIINTFDRITPIEYSDNELLRLKHKEITRADFLNEIINSFSNNDDALIVDQLSFYVDEIYIDIINSDDSLDNQKVDLLYIIAENTKTWIKALCINPTEQYRLLSTICSEHIITFEEFNNKDSFERFILLIACQKDFKRIIKFMWKIMLDICLFKPDFDASKNADMLNPETYIVNCEKNYICFRFSGDCVNTSVILPPLTNCDDIDEIRRLYIRFSQYRPEKWFLSGSNKICGKCDYEYKINEIRNVEKITQVREDNESFYCECMECIDINSTQWNIPERCDECIFLDSCKKGKWE